MTNARMLGLLLVLAWIDAPRAFANDEPVEFECEDGVYDKSEFFTDIQSQAEAINLAFCDALNVPVSENLVLRNRVSDFAAEVYQITNERFARTGLEKMAPQLDYFTSQVRSGALHPNSMPAFVLGNPVSPAEPRQYYFNGNQRNFGSLSGAMEPTCYSEFGSNTCSEVLRDFADAIFPYQVNYNAFKADRTAKQLDDLSMRWDAFFEDGRPQTTVDLIVTTKLERKHFQTGRLVGPPSRQWFLLHPEVVLEYVDSAPEGDQFKAGLAVEWIGVNSWEGSWIGVPLGISITSLYSDRAEVDDIGHGVTIHVKNSLSFGWARRDSDNTIFVSLDLLTLFEDKKDRVEKFEKVLSKN